jgi:hypothetical protein
MLIVWLLLLAGAAVIVHGAPNVFLEAVGSLLTFSSMYGYTVLLTFVPQLGVPAYSRRLAAGCAVTLAVLYVIGLFMGDSFEHRASHPPVGYPIGIGVGVVMLLPFVLAARALRTVELAVGQRTAFGLASALLWLLYWPVGVFFVQRRLRRALHQQASAGAGGR